MERIPNLSFPLTCTIALLLVCAGTSTALASQRSTTAKPDNFAQKLVNQARSNHPDATEIGISLQSARGCSTIASTDPGDIGEKCEQEDTEPLRIGKPHVEKERDGFDVSVPLRDASGKLIGTLAVEFKPQAGQTRADVTRRAEEIASEMAGQIPSKAKLRQPAE